MHLITIKVEVRIRVGFRSRRQTLRAILAKLHRHFNVSIIELTGAKGSAEEKILGIAALGATRRDVRHSLDELLGALAAHPRVNIAQVDWTDH